ncbi:NifU family protein [bacterium]|nr:NifU family protein [bacterium]
MIDKVEEALNSIRPFLQKDGGDVELIDVSDEMDVHIKLMGSCANCSMSNMTMKNGIEESIRRLVPQVRKIVEVAD